MKKLHELILGSVLVTTSVFAHEGHGAKAKKGAVPKTHASLAPLSTVPSFSLADQNGAMVSLDSLKGKTWISDFIYTSCADECPLMTIRMKALQTKLADVVDLAFVSITTDPKIDTPKVLKTYAQAHHANEANWSFLTGDKKAIVELSVKGFKLPADEKSRNHSEHFVLVDSQGRIRGYYDSTEAKGLASIERDVRTVSQTK